MNRQREVVYDERRRVLEGADLPSQISTMIDDVVTSYVDGATGEGFPEEWDLDGLWRALKQLYPVGITVDQVDRGGRRRARPHLTSEFLIERIIADAHAAYERREEELGAGAHARARAAGPALGARPQVARAPLRDGLPAGGHRPARRWPARPAGRVPARGLRHVHRHDGRDQGGVGRLPVQPRGRGAAGPDRGREPRRRVRSAPPRPWGHRCPCRRPWRPWPGRSGPGGRGPARPGSRLEPERRGSAWRGSGRLGSGVAQAGMAPVRAVRGRAARVAAASTARVRPPSLRTAARVAAGTRRRRPRSRTTCRPAWPRRAWPGPSAPASSTTPRPPRTAQAPPALTRPRRPARPTTPRSAATRRAPAARAASSSSATATRVTASAPARLQRAARRSAHRTRARRDRPRVTRSP